MALDSDEQYWLGEDRKTESWMARPKVAVLRDVRYARVHANKCPILRYKGEEMRRNSEYWHGPFAGLSTALSKGLELFGDVVKCPNCIGGDHSPGPPHPAQARLPARQAGKSHNDRPGTSRSPLRRLGSRMSRQEQTVSRSCLIPCAKVGRIMLI